MLEAVTPAQDSTKMFVCSARKPLTRSSLGKQPDELLVASSCSLATALASQNQPRACRHHRGGIVGHAIFHLSQ